MPDQSPEGPLAGQPGDPGAIDVAAEQLDATPGGAPDDAEAIAPEPGPSRRRRVLLGALIAAALAGAATLGTTGWRIYDQKDAKLSTPDQLVGFRRDDSERALATADYLRTALAAAVSVDRVVGAVYQDPTDPRRSVLYFGGTKLLWSPQRELDTVLGVVAGEAGKITGQHDVPPGDLDGVMKCGSTTTAEGDIAVCGWADHGSIGVAMFPDRKPDESAPLLRQFRETTQTRE